MIDSRARVGLCLLAAWWCGGVTLGEAGSGERPKIDKAFISFRIGTNTSIPDKRYEELLALFERYKGVTDEITFFTSETHPPLPLEVIRKRAEILGRRMEQARKLGYRTGINILSTMGHHNESLGTSLSGKYTPTTDQDGNVCQGSLCPNDENLREYVRQVYEMVTAAGPDYIWIDDDVRLAGHMPIFLTCFCDNCLAIFEKETGKKHTRETIKAAFQSASMDERLALRRAWLQHNRNTIGRLFKLIEETVHKAKPGLPLGFMTGDRFYEGYDFDTWAGILSGPAKAEVRWRPGGGFYEDGVPGGLAQKSHDIGRQVSVLPPEVVSIQSEIENFPYQRLKKAAHITMLEAASHIAAGCTGAAFNVLAMADEPLDEYEPLVARLREARPYYDLLARQLGRERIVGVWPVWSKDSSAACGVASGDLFAFAGFLRDLSPAVFEIGLPACYSPDGARVAMVSGDAARALTKEQIQKMLSSGVYLDAPALTDLNEMGFGELTGFTVERTEPIDRMERFTNHPLNGPFAGRERDGRQSFYKWPGYALKRSDEKAQSLAGLIDYAENEITDCTMGVFENRLGGRVCVGGYFPWTFLHNLSKSSQMKSVMRWLSKDRLPAYVASLHKVQLWVREPAKGQLAVALTNSSFDAAKDMTLILLTDATTVRVFDMNCGAASVSSSGTDGPYKKFTIPEVGPWQMRLVVTGEGR